MRWLINQSINQDIHTDASVRARHILDIILYIRGLTSPSLINSFLYPPVPTTFTLKSAGLDSNSIQTATKLIHQAINYHQPIIIYGDYDADGITATAILWETLDHLGAKAIPFIPSREKHGYGLSINGLKDALKLITAPEDKPPLIITVDNGIVANESADWLRSQKIPLIITDHHQPKNPTPHALAIVHSQTISGAGVAWILSNQLDKEYSATTLDLLAIGTIADMMPLIGINRSFAKHGLEALSKTKRKGVLALLSEASIVPDETLTPYHVNYVLAPRINAMGRLEHGLDSLRLLCTRNQSRAHQLAQKLGSTNRLRQDLTQELLSYATNMVDDKHLDSIIVVDDPKYHEGIIGLIAGKLAETYYRPAIVISSKNDVSKASARSIKGINITELIRSQSDLLLGVGGHPMAAGFSIQTDKIEIFKQAILKYAKESIDSKLFKPVLDIDCLVSIDEITNELYSVLIRLQPFGIGNKQPVFAIKKAIITEVKTMGKDNQHLKILIQTNNQPLEALWFNHGDQYDSLKSATTIDLAFTISQNTWRNKTKLQLIIKDIL